MIKFRAREKINYISRNRKMTDEELTNRIAAMTLEEKALQLTQYPADEIISEGEKIVTGICNLGSLQKSRFGVRAVRLTHTT